MKTIYQLLKTFKNSFYYSFVVMVTITALQISSNYAQAAQTTLAWDPPVNADGTLFTAFSGYKLHMGNAPGSYTQSIDVGNTTTYTLNNLSEGLTYYFAVSDYDNNGNESSNSNEVSKAFPYTYSLIATANPGGSISPVGNITASTVTNGTSTITSVTVTQGSTQAFSITPNSGYNISDVRVDNISVGKVTSYTFNNASADHTLIADFTSNVISTYSITASAGLNGSITPSGSVTVNNGASQTYNIAPATGYKIADVKVDGISVGAVASYTLSNITANHTIAASFTNIPATTYTISATAGTGGSSSPTGTATVASGASSAYTIAPAAGYKIADVKVDGVSVGAVTSYTFNNVTANHTIAASFASNLITITVTASAGSGGSISPVGKTVQNSTSSITYTITPNSGYSIADVKVNGASIGAVSSYTFTFPNSTASYTIDASFKLVTTTYAITATAGIGGSISPTGTATVTSGASNAYTITPAAGYTIADVKVDGLSVGAVTNYTFNNVTANHTIAASFASNPITITVNASAGTGGIISPIGQTVQRSNSSITYTITPNTGYSIADVTVNGISVGAVSSYTFSFPNSTASYTIAASFKAITTAYAITATAGTGGNITPAGTSQVAKGTSKTFTITPATGYRITGVRIDGVYVGAIARYTFNNVAKNHSISASFKRKIW